MRCGKEGCWDGEGGWRLSDVGVSPSGRGKGWGGGGGRRKEGAGGSERGDIGEVKGGVGREGVRMVVFGEGRGGVYTSYSIVFGSNRHLPCCQLIKKNSICS